MKLLVLFFMLLILSFAIYYLGEHLYSDFLEFTGIILGGIMAAVILVAFVGLIVEHGTVNSKINDHKVVQQMVNDSDKLSAEEKAVVLEKKLDWNRDLSKYKYYDKSDWVGIFYPSKVAKLPYIK